MKRTNLDIKDLACLHVVHTLQHPTFRPTTRSTQDTMVNAPEKTFSPLPVGKYSKSTKHSAHRRHQANECKSGLEEAWTRAWRGLHILRCKTTLSAEKRQETHNLSNVEKEKWIEDYVERETAVARNRVRDAETAIMPVHEDMTTAENAGATTS